MVLSVDGNSEIGSPVGGNLSYLIWLGHLIRARAVSHRIFSLWAACFDRYHLIQVPWCISNFSFAVGMPQRRHCLTARAAVVIICVLMPTAHSKLKGKLIAFIWMLIHFFFCNRIFNLKLKNLDSLSQSRQSKHLSSFLCAYARSANYSWHY